eukprot:COSAG06_NODE_2911_length_6102_cov_2.217724_4_plen_141_part_00
MSWTSRVSPCPFFISKTAPLFSLKLLEGSYIFLWARPVDRASNEIGACLCFQQGQTAPTNRDMSSWQSRVAAQGDVLAKNFGFSQHSCSGGSFNANKLLKEFRLAARPVLVRAWSAAGRVLELLVARSQKGVADEPPRRP